MTQPKPNSYLPDSWDAIVQPMFAFGAYATRPRFTSALSFWLAIP